MNVLITGITGFIGGELALQLHQRGHSIVGTTRKPELIQPQIPLLSLRRFCIDEPFDATILEGVDIVVHAAHDFSPGAMDRNVETTKAFFSAASELGIQRQVFLSSFSARPDAVTEYGRTKYAIEKFFLEGGAIVVRPGLVVGRGGIFARISKLLSRFPAIPLVDGGTGLVPVIHVSTLAQALVQILERPFPLHEYNLYHQELVQLKELVNALRRSVGSRALMIPVPSKLLLLPLSALKKLHIPVPIDIDNLKAFVLNQDVIHDLNLHDLGICECSITELFSDSVY